MSDVFFPSCRAAADYPAASRRLAAYLYDRLGVLGAGCCRGENGYAALAAGDRAIVVCPTCAAIFEESAAVRDIIFVWELIDQDSGFVFPDYGGERMTVQDCWVCAEKRGVQDAVRSLLKKMNIEAVEQAENFGRTRFCGANMLKEPVGRIARLAPDRYFRRGAGFFHPMDEAARTEALRLHCSRISTESVVCYCRYCRDGICRGGKRGRHLLELLFP